MQVLKDRHEIAAQTAAYKAQIDAKKKERVRVMFSSALSGALEKRSMISPPASAFTGGRARSGYLDPTSRRRRAREEAPGQGGCDSRGSTGALTKCPFSQLLARGRTSSFEMPWR